MKTTSIFIPLLIIGCLAALIYLFYAALQATEAATPDNNAPIILNQADYLEEDPEDLGDNVNLEPYFQEVPEEQGREEDERQPLGTAPVTGADPRPDAPRPATGSTATTPVAPPAPATNTATAATGRYLVIAGSFRQLSGAEERVRSLRQAGFSETTVERFNRGAFAVALAGQSDRYSEAVSLAGRLRAAGFEARVMRRR